MTIGEKIRVRRNQLDMTMEDLGKAIGVQRSAINKYEKDLIDFKTSTILALSKALNVSVFYLLDEDPHEELSSDEQFVVDTYRTLSDPGKQYIHQQLTIASHMFGGKSEDAHQTEPG